MSIHSYLKDGKTFYRVILGQTASKNNVEDLVLNLKLAKLSVNFLLKLIVGEKLQAQGSH